MRALLTGVLVGILVGVGLYTNGFNFVGSLCMGSAANIVMQGILDE